MSAITYRFRLFWRYLKVALSSKVKLTINVMGNEETVDYILKNNSSVVRFGEGEVQLMCGGNLDFQAFDQKLANRMKEILTIPSSEKFIVCVPDVFQNVHRFRFPVQCWWQQHLQKYQQFYQNTCTSDWYGSAFISRPYMDWKKKEIRGGYFDKLKELWEHRDLLIVEGRFSRSGVGNDLFDNANSIQRILCPPQNAYDRYDEIVSCVKANAEDKLILIMLGPTAKVLAYDLHLDGLQAIDLGHLDSEYEWCKMGVRRKVKIANKHTAEYNYDHDVMPIDDTVYQSQIIADLSL